MMMETLLIIFVCLIGFIGLIALAEFVHRKLFQMDGIAKKYTIHCAHVEPYDDFECLNYYAKVAFETTKSVGFHQDDEQEKVSEYLINLQSEVCELWEAYRRNQWDLPCDKADKMREPLTCKEEEAADIQLRLLDFVHKEQIDLARACRIKNAFNRTRPFRNGGRKC